MIIYQNKGRRSGVAGFDVTENSITVYFKGGLYYLYNEVKPGLKAVHEMIELAKAGEGLNTYINKYVHDDYASKHI